jgi:hypothetical protein
MKPPGQDKTDPIEREIERALRPGVFIRDGECFSFVSGLDQVTEPAATRLEKSHPELAARLWRAQGMRIVDAKKSKYYDAALSNFERARNCYQRAGLAVEWEKTVRRVCALHYRKTGFINGFRTFRCLELALYHSLGKLPEPESTHEFF